MTDRPAAGATGAGTRSLPEPEVTVVIASYRWPEALRLSLESALAQTLASIEVLVIEDGTDAASGKVVLEVADPRARSASLSSTSGSQSGPNADGWRLARAPIIAYLGHDDLWHPEHLERLVETLTPEFDVAHAISFYLGDDADDRLEVAGSHPWDETMFVPPSSIAHWRDSPRLGTWRGAGESGEPVDYAFLVACARRGARFAGSGAPTVFKHPAAWRLDAYRTRDVEPQLKTRALLAADPGFGRALLKRALAAGIPDVLPAPSPAAPGVIADHNRRLKGLPARFAEPVRHWRAGEGLPFPGWHPAERDAVGSYAWTGPDERAIVRLDAPPSAPASPPPEPASRAPGRGALGVRIVVRHTVLIEQLETLRVELDGVTVIPRREVGTAGAVILTAWLERPAAQATVEVVVATHTVDPRIRVPDSPDRRLLGIAVAEIELLHGP